MFFAALTLSALALADDALCPRPDAPGAQRSVAVADSGDAYLLTAEGPLTCLWRVDDNEDGRVLTRWAADGPMAVATAADTLVLLFADGRVSVRGERERFNLTVPLAGPVAGVIGHPELRRIAVLSGGVALVVDLDTERTLALSSYRPGEAVYFLPGLVDLQILSAPAFSDSRQSRR